MNKQDFLFRSHPMDEDGCSESVKSPKRINENSGQKLRRRSKKDKIGRNFICGCGKKYLSYPALYTHIKTKHNGSQPEGTKQFNNSKTKRGRPKKHEFREDDKTSIMESNLINNINNTNSKNEFIHILSEGFSTEDLSVLKSLDVNCLGSCDPKVFFQRFHQMKLNVQTASKYKGDHPFLQYFEKIENGENPLSKQNCDFVFSLFLFHSSKIVSSKFYEILAIFFCHLRECLNYLGYTFLNELKEINEKFIAEEMLRNIDEKNNNNIDIDSENLRKEEYCENESPEEIPYIANFFILYYLPKHSNFFDQSLAVRIILDFVKFMNKNNFSQKKLIFNKSKLDDSISFHTLFERKK